MARPHKSGMDYFPHDTDASNDEKLEALTALYGSEGYAFYFILLERIYRTDNFELDVSDAETIQILSRKCLTTPERFTAMLKTSIKNGCFDKEAYEERKVLTSRGIKKRALVVVEKRERMRTKSPNPECNEVTEAVTPVLAGVSAAETMAKSTQSKVKESKEKKSRDLVTRTSATSYPQLTHKDFILRPDDNEFMIFVNGIKSLIARENQHRHSNPFTWKATTGDLESDLRSLVYGNLFSKGAQAECDKTKEAILSELYNVNGERLNWITAVHDAILLVIRTSEKKPVHHPFGLTLHFLGHPNEIINAKTDGVRFKIS